MKNFKRSFLFHLAIVLVLCALLYVSFFATLHWVTRHGDEVVIPDVRGQLAERAIATLKAKGFDVYLDSTYEPAFKPTAVLKQVPDTGSIVKPGRTVFLTTNMLSPPHIPMPNLASLSFRSALMLLRNNKLRLGDTTYKPDIAAGAILEQNYMGRSIRPGEMIAQGSKIDLVIGDGLGNTEFDVPHLNGISVDEALTILQQYNVTPVIVTYDELSKITDTLAAIVVDTEPRAENASGTPNRIKEGDIIHLKIMMSPSEQELRQGNSGNSTGVNSQDQKNKKP